MNKLTSLQVTDNLICQPFHCYLVNSDLTARDGAMLEDSKKEHGRSACTQFRVRPEIV